MPLPLQVSELASIIGKDSGYVRQHIHRGHLNSYKDDIGRVMVDYEEAQRWAHSRDLPFGDVEISKVTHAMIVPFPVSNLVTWCGHRVNSRAVKNDRIAFAPESVTCRFCIAAMKDAYKNLGEWVPKLS